MLLEKYPQNPDSVEGCCLKLKYTTANRIHVNNLVAMGMYDIARRSIKVLLVYYHYYCIFSVQFVRFISMDPDWSNY